MCPWNQWNVSRVPGTVQGSRGRHDLPAPFTVPGWGHGAAAGLSWSTRLAGWGAGQQGQGPNNHAALEPGLGQGLVCTDTTEQLLARGMAFWGEAGHLRQSRAGKWVQPVCMSPPCRWGASPQLLEREAGSSGTARSVSLHPTLTFEPLLLLLVHRIKP